MREVSTDVRRFTGERCLGQRPRTNQCLKEGESRSVVDGDVRRELAGDAKVASRDRNEDDQAVRRQEEAALSRVERSVDDGVDEQQSLG